jgi:uncharacterized protein (TIGR00288 family)
MNMPYQAGPRFAGGHPVSAPNAALLIDFDNVTMGMRSDLSKDLRKLLDSDIIRGKVTVQRAYADWRRYPQYIVPLSENSIDLIFAPAYGSSKKNATDIRMAIDGMELIFTRPEIGTYILLTGDSDFSSLVLKLKEYGKYVIGVGLQESSSDILVQNCDEYYSYTNFAGLQKTTEAGDRTQVDPWVLTEKAVARMEERGDVMRSDRLKQVMRELDPQFDEGKFGFSKFSRFVAEAASRDLIKLKRADNGQYEVSPVKGGGSSSSKGDREDRRDDRRDDRKGRGRGRGRGGRNGRNDRGPDTRETAAEEREAAVEETSSEARRTARDETPAERTGDFAEGIEGAYEVMLAALDRLREADRYPARGSDVKRRILEVRPGFDEAEYGFPKFSLFLKAAEADGLIRVTRLDNGGFEVEQGDADPAEAAAAHVAAKQAEESADDEPHFERTDRHAERQDTSSGADETTSAQESTDEPAASASSTEPVVETFDPSDFVSDTTPGRRLGPRGGTTRRRADGPPPLFEGQGAPSASTSTAAVQEDEDTIDVGDLAPDDDEFDAEAELVVDQPDAPETASAPAGEPIEAIDAEALGLPTDRDAQIAYLTNSYKGIGEKTAETVVEAFGERLFEVLNNEPDRVRDLLPGSRGEQLLEAWDEDIERRVVRLAQGPHGDDS